MKLLLHDAYRTFDYVACINAVFDKMVDRDFDYLGLADQLNVSTAWVAKFFKYERVSLPMLIIACRWAGVDMAKYVIFQD